MSKTRFSIFAILFLFLASTPFSFALAQGPTGLAGGGVAPPASGRTLPDAPRADGCVAYGLGPGLFESVTGTWNGGAGTFYFAGVLFMEVNGQQVPGFCMDLLHEVNLGDCGFVKAGPAAAKIYWILLHYPAGSGLSNEDAAAIQAAIWFHSDGFVVTAPAAVVAKTAAILASVPASPDVAPVITFSPAAQAQDVATFDVAVTLTVTREGNPLVGKTLTLAADAGTLTPNSVTTDNSGRASFKISNNSGNPLTARVTATLSYEESTQYTLMGKQTLLFSVPADAQAQGRYNWTKSPTAVQLASLSARESGSDLPLATTAAMLLLAGTAGFLVRRKTVSRNHRR